MYEILHSEIWWTPKFILLHFTGGLSTFPLSLDGICPHRSEHLFLQIDILLNVQKNGFDCDSFRCINHSTLLFSYLYKTSLLPYSPTYWFSSSIKIIISSAFMAYKFHQPHSCLYMCLWILIYIHMYVSVCMYVGTCLWVPIEVKRGHHKP